MRKGCTWDETKARFRINRHTVENQIWSDGNRDIYMITEVREDGFGGLSTVTSFKVLYKAEDRRPDHVLSLDKAISLVYAED